MSAFIKKRYEDVWINIIIITRGWVSVNFPEKSGTGYVTLECRPTGYQKLLHYFFTTKSKKAGNEQQIIVSVLVGDILQ